MRLSREEYGDGWLEPPRPDHIEEEVIDEFGEVVDEEPLGENLVNDVRAELAGSSEDAARILTAGGRLVVYNVAQVLMRVFAELAAPAGRPGSSASGG